MKIENMRGQYLEFHTASGDGGCFSLGPSEAERRQGISFIYRRYRQANPTWSDERCLTEAKAEYHRKR